MKPKQSIIPRLESLEDRCLPASVLFIGGALYVSNPASNLTVTQTANNTFKVQDGGASYGPFSKVKAVSVNSGLGTHNTTVDLGNHTFTGSLVINAPGGNDVITFEGAGGTIFGNVSIQTGTGKDQIVIPNAVTVDGFTQINMGTGNSTFTVTGAATFNGLFVVNVSTGSDSIAITNPAATINGSTYILTGVGNTTLNLGTAFTINGNVVIFMGNGNDLITLNANVNGNMYMILGNGNDTLSITSAGPPNGPTFYLTTGNGNDLVTLTPSAPNAWFLNWNFGNGSDTINLAGSQAETISGFVRTGDPVDFWFIQGANWRIASYFVSNF